MTDRPIIFSKPMVEALLAGRKTQTRRILKLPTKGEYVRPDMGGWAPTTIGGGRTFTVAKDGSRTPYPEKVAIWNRTTGTCIVTSCQPADRLWVRENCRGTERESDGVDGVLFDADNAFIPIESNRAAADRWLELFSYAQHRKPIGRGKTVPSIHMPRWASRLTLIVEGVKVERLQDISEDDAVAEGLWYSETGDAAGFWFASQSMEGPCGGGSVECYARLWEHLHGPEAWEANPWVVAITFRGIKANIDALEAAA